MLIYIACAFVYIVRWFHRDSRFLYKLLDSMYVQNEIMRNRYMPMTGTRYCRIRLEVNYFYITGLILLTDKTRHLCILLLEMKNMFAVFEPDRTGDHVQRRGSSMKPEGYDVDTPSLRYFPLNYKDNEVFWNF